MRTIKLTISYDGTNYVGWQVQPNGVSVQALVQAAVRKMTGEENAVVGASRTDAGVHAVAQAAHFETQSEILCENFRMGINSILPPDIAVTFVSDVHAGFHARRDAKGKKYIYRILVSDERGPLLQSRFWHIRKMPDVKAMKAAAKVLVGEHDFSSFCAAGSGAKNAVRKINSIKIKTSRPSPEFFAGEGRVIDLVFKGEGFVRHQIRNIVGTLVDIGFGKIEKGEMKKILAARDRKKAGRKAPACGLYLVKVFY